jgi:hypothetical protein
MTLNRSIAYKGVGNAAQTMQEAPMRNCGTYEVLIGKLAVPHHAGPAYRALLNAGFDALPAIREGWLVPGGTIYRKTVPRARKIRRRKLEATTLASRVMPRLVPGIQSATRSGACLALDPGDKRRDDKGCHIPE